MAPNRALQPKNRNNPPMASIVAAPYKYKGILVIPLKAISSAVGWAVQNYSFKYLKLDSKYLPFTHMLFATIHRCQPCDLTQTRF
ncbi:MAG: hypothetical protein K940chlam7_01357, partial [Chlamydiae bacterium]|nr:hypothetical protein [Chlamydiota bacterium]